MHIFLGIVLFIVAILSVVSTVKQLKEKNLFAVAFSALSVVTFGFFSVMTVISEIAS